MIYSMDSGTCAKSLRKPDLHTNEFGHRKDFFQGGNSGFFQVVWTGFNKLLCIIIKGCAVVFV